jgi:hypothetical protein
MIRNTPTRSSFIIISLVEPRIDPLSVDSRVQRVGNKIQLETAQMDASIAKNLKIHRQLASTRSPPLTKTARERRWLFSGIRGSHTANLTPHAMNPHAIPIEIITDAAMSLVRCLAWSGYICTIIELLLEDILESE